MIVTNSKGVGFYIAEHNHKDIPVLTKISQNLRHIALPLIVSALSLRAFLILVGMVYL